MAVKHGTTSIIAIKHADTTLIQVYHASTPVFTSTLTYTTGTLPTGVASLTCYRAVSPMGGSIGEIASGSIIYSGDELYWSATADSGYRVSVAYWGGTPKAPVRYTVTGNVTGVNAAGISRQVYITFSGTGCAPYKNSNYSTMYTTGYYDLSSTATTIYYKASPSYAFNNSGTNTFNYAVAFDAPKTVSISATHGYVTFTGTHCSCTSHSNGWYPLNVMINSTWQAETGWSFEDDTVFQRSDYPPETIEVEASYQAAAVSVASGLGINYAWLSLSPTSTAGSSTAKPSGSYFPIGRTVYAFVRLGNDGYVANRLGSQGTTAWTKISGNWDAVSSQYRVASKTVSNTTTSNNFGTINGFGKINYTIEGYNYITCTSAGDQRYEAGVYHSIGIGTFKYTPSISSFSSLWFCKLSMYEGDACISYSVIPATGTSVTIYGTVSAPEITLYCGNQQAYMPSLSMSGVGSACAGTITFNSAIPQGFKAYVQIHDQDDHYFNYNDYVSAGSTSVGFSGMDLTPYEHDFLLEVSFYPASGGTKLLSDWWYCDIDDYIEEESSSSET